MLAEAMYRVLRDQENIAGHHKHMANSEVRIVTLSEER